MVIGWPQIQTAIVVLVPFLLWALTMKIRWDNSTMFKEHAKEIKELIDARDAKLRSEFTTAFASQNVVVQMETNVDRRFNAMETSVDKRFNSMETKMEHLAKREDLIVIQSDMKHALKIMEELVKVRNDG